MENAVEEAVEKAPNKVLIRCGEAGAALLVGGLLYKFAVKPIIKKVKSIKNRPVFDAVEDADFQEIDVENE